MTDDRKYVGYPELGKGKRTGYVILGKTYETTYELFFNYHHLKAAFVFKNFKAYLFDLMDFYKEQTRQYLNTPDRKELLEELTRYAKMGEAIEINDHVDYVFKCAELEAAISMVIHEAWKKEFPNLHESWFDYGFDTFMGHESLEFYRITADGTNEKKAEFNFKEEKLGNESQYFQKMVSDIINGV